MLTISIEDRQAIAAEVCRQLRAQPIDSDTRLTKAQAATYLGVSASTFDRLRSAVTMLRPVSESPLRWSRSIIDQYKTQQRRLLMQSITS